MATDTRQPKQTLTLAEICEAIADEKVHFTTLDDAYQLTALDIRRMSRTDDYLDIPTELLAEFADIDSSEAGAY